MAQPCSTRLYKLALILDPLVEIRLSFLDELLRTRVWCQSSGESDLDRLSPYVVHDIPCGEPGRPRIILLLESPHTIEVCRGYPLAGSSGADVTTALRPILGVPDDPCDCPFGEMLQHPALDEYLQSFGVMNVSRLPMQSAAYLCPVRRAFDAILFDHFKTLRRPNAIVRRNGDPVRNHHLVTREIKRLLIDDLKNRIQLTRTDAYFIPCGGVAKAFFGLANANVGRNRICFDVPHPSYGHWRRTENREILCNLRQEISQRLQQPSSAPGATPRGREPGRPRRGAVPARR